MNGDGYSDIITGAPRLQLRPGGEGRCLRVLRLADRTEQLDTRRTLQRNQAGARIRRPAVSSAGDVNQDGYSDVVVGAPGWSNGADGQGSIAVYLRFGRRALHEPGLHLSNRVRWAPSFGEWVAPAGDVDRDGYSDFAVGAPNAAKHRSGGRLCVPRHGVGRRDVLDRRRATETSGHFGAPVQGAGDVDGDGYPDLAVGAPDEAVEGRTRAGLHGQLPPLRRAKPEASTSSRSNGAPTAAVRSPCSAPPTPRRRFSSASGCARRTAGAMVRLDWDVEPLGTGWVNTRTSPQWYDSGVPGASGSGQPGQVPGRDHGTAQRHARTTGGFGPGPTRRSSPALRGSRSAATRRRRPTSERRPDPSAAPDRGRVFVGSLRKRHAAAGSSGREVRFSLSIRGPCAPHLHDVAGRRLVTLADGDLAAGAHAVQWDGRDGAGNAAGRRASTSPDSSPTEEVAAARIVVSR